MLLHNQLFGLWQQGRPIAHYQNTSSVINSYNYISNLEHSWSGPWIHFWVSTLQLKTLINVYGQDFSTRMKLKGSCLADLACLNICRLVYRLLPRQHSLDHSWSTQLNIAVVIAGTQMSNMIKTGFDHPNLIFSYCQHVHIWLQCAEHCALNAQCAMEIFKIRKKITDRNIFCYKDS